MWLNGDTAPYRQVCFQSIFGVGPRLLQHRLDWILPTGNLSRPVFVTCFNQTGLHISPSKSPTLFKFSFSGLQELVEPKISNFTITCFKRDFTQSPIQFKFTLFLPTKALQAIGIRFHMAAQLHNHSDQSTQPQEVQSRTIKKRLLNQFTQFVNFLDFCLNLDYLPKFTPTWSQINKLQDFVLFLGPRVS